MVLVYWIWVCVHLLQSLCHCWIHNSFHICNAKNSSRQMTWSFWNTRKKLRHIKYKYFYRNRWNGNDLYTRIAWFIYKNCVVLCYPFGRWEFGCSIRRCMEFKITIYKIPRWNETLSFGNKAMTKFTHLAWFLLSIWPISFFLFI